MRALLVLVILSLSLPALAQEELPKEWCNEGETPEDCRLRLCKRGETIEECKERVREEYERLKEQEEERAEEERERREKERERREEEAEEERERREEERRERERERDRDDDDDDDDDDDSGGGGSDILRPGTRPMFFVGAIGPTFFGLNRGRRIGAVRSNVEARARVALDFGYHFSGTMEGPAIGATIEQTFSDGDSFYVFNPGFKFWWDIQPVDDYGIYIAPFAKAGYAGAFCGRRRFGCPYHAFNIGLGVEGRLVLGDRGLVLLRLVQVDTYLGDFFNETFWLNYSLLIGGGVIF